MGWKRESKQKIEMGIWLLLLIQLLGWLGCCSRVTIAKRKEFLRASQEMKKWG